MTNILEKICNDKLEYIRRKKLEVPQSALIGMAKKLKTRGFLNNLRIKSEKGEFALIAEVKKASPSKGIIRPDFNHINIALEYERGGACCISVLTDEPYFQGRNEYLREIRDKIKLPILRKDFMLDPYQIIESAALGADCILLIMAALSDSQAKELEDTAREFNLDILVEVHDEKELERALKLDSRLIGINNRDLKTLRVDLANSERLSKLIPEDYIKVCESGISDHNDLKRMKNSGIYCFLVGESLMIQNNIYHATRKLLGYE